MHARMHLRTLTHINHRRAARSHVCRHVCSNMQAAHMSPAGEAGDFTAHKHEIAPRGSRGRRIAGPSDIVTVVTVAASPLEHNVTQPPKS